ncbi:MAG: phage tail protein [Fimbriimonas sp.]
MADQQAPQGLEGLDIRVVPDEIKVILGVEPAGLSPAGVGLRPPRPYPQNGRVRVVSTSDHYRSIRLSVESDSESFAPKWVKWSFVRRQAPALAGGDAVDAQDGLFDQDRVLVLWLAPGETREVTLAFDVSLDGETQPGDYPFRVVAAEEGVGEQRASGTLNLRHPQSSLLGMLPSIYQEAMLELAREEPAPGPPFFERFLIGFEDAINPIRQTLDQLDRLFGPYSTPPQYLVWLAAWLTLPQDEHWTEMRRRRLVKEAVELFRWRGTPRGLKRYLQIYTGYEPMIDDQPVEGWRLGSHALLGSDQTVLGDVPPHTFVVTLAVPDPSVINEAVVRDIIRSVKPAHTAYTLNIVRRES